MTPPQKKTPLVTGKEIHIFGRHNGIVLKRRGKVDNRYFYVVLSQTSTCEVCTYTFYFRFDHFAETVSMPNGVDS